jgi:putative lipoic acid-binding regulatory protein
MTRTTIIEFPCYFPVKIIGTNTQSFLHDIKEITAKHFPDLTDSDVTHKLSQQSNFLAITVTVYVQSQELLDAYYQALVKHPDIKMVL